MVAPTNEKDNTKLQGENQKTPPLCKGRCRGTRRRDCYSGGETPPLQANIKVIIEPVGATIGRPRQTQ